MTLLHPANSGKFIADNAVYVHINSSGVHNLAVRLHENMRDGKLALPSYTDENLIPPKDDNAVDWIFIHDALNFCFWTPGDATKWKVNGYTGYYALCAAFNRAIKEGFDICNAEFCSKVTKEQVAHIMRSDDGSTVIPLLDLRVTCLNEVGRVLLEKFNGTFKTCLTAADKSVKCLLDIAVSNFPCFRDEAKFKGSVVSFYKRAQILIADLWSNFSGKGWGEFTDIDELTMFADYRVPQVLVHFNVLEYNEELMNILKTDTILLNGSQEEVEIRGCSIHAVELVKCEVRKLIKKDGLKVDSSNLNSSLIDYYLWLYRRDHEEELKSIPFHKVLSQYY